jgi:hypothetical protein
LAVEVREMQDEEVIVVVDIDFGPLVDRFTVFDVEGMEVKTVLEELEVLFARVVQVAPSYLANFETVDHVVSPRIEFGCKTKQKFLKKKR